MCWYGCFLFFFFFKQKTAYEMRISDWSSDVCSSDLGRMFMYENFNGTPLYGIITLTMARDEMTGAGAYGKFASKVAGIEFEGEDNTLYTSTADYAKAQDKGFGVLPNKACPLGTGNSSPVRCSSARTSGGKGKQ